MDMILNFIEAACYIEPSLSQNIQDLYESYKIWAKESNLKKLNKKSFIAFINQTFPKGKGIYLKPYEEWEFWDKSELKRIYFISNGTYIKIGISLIPELRIKALQTGCPEPLTLLGSISGNEELEKHLHNLYKFYHIRGEWFNLNPELVKKIIYEYQNC